MGDKSTAEGPESTDTDRYLVDETPEQRPSGRRERDRVGDSFTVGYDELGDTRVGIGSAGGDIEKLVRLNEGRHPSDGDHSVREAKRDKVRITQSFCSHLNLPQHQQQEAAAAMKKMNLDRFGRQKRLAKVALATIRVVVEWDRFHRNLGIEAKDVDEDNLPKRMLEEEAYRDLLEQQSVSTTDLYSVSQLVKRELKKHNHFRPGAPDGSGASDEVGADEVEEQ